MDKQEVIDAIVASGGEQGALDEADDLWLRLDLLDKTGRYGRLLSSLTKANDKSNFLALVLETNFAYQFESQGLALTYEVKQGAGGSIDFLRQIPGGDRMYFELRLLQQAPSISDSINAQLEKWGIYRFVMGGDEEQNEVVRLQNAILGKVQDRNGKRIKFFLTDPHVVNVVVVDATESILGAVDVHDCMLATYGDPSVEEVYRRKVFGLFQEDRPEYPQRIHDVAAKYRYIRSMLHGVLFLFKERDTGILAYRLEQYLMWNPALVDEAKARPIVADLTQAIPVRRNR